jgi:5-methylcytosine-specific restriction enzyme A
MAERIRGRKAVHLRIRRLNREPLCRDCLAKGMYVASSVPDHIIPLSLGGTDDDDNIRCLCKDCHRIRTAEQFGHRKIIFSKPDKDGWGGGIV